MTNSIMFTKAKAFALRIVRLYKYLCDHKESVIAKQMLRSGISIGANITESRHVFRARRGRCVEHVVINQKSERRTEGAG